jgi:hypothetical protein
LPTASARLAARTPRSPRRNGRARGRSYDEARCTQFAATLCGLEGRLDEAKVRCTRALALCGSEGPVAVSAYAELGEIALARGDHSGAANAFGAALDAGDATGLVDAARAALLRKRAVALTAGGRYRDASAICVRHTTV